mmetsp:Transcript_883/g.1253  ORF Transcript_883/g.1253 Transcript_883/m.1253 type:complete len:90 (-) Transcript_883:489-758(-)
MLKGGTDSFCDNNNMSKRNINFGINVQILDVTLESLKNTNKLNFSTFTEIFTRFNGRKKRTTFAYIDKELINTFYIVCVVQSLQAITLE